MPHAYMLRFILKIVFEQSENQKSLESLRETLLGEEVNIEFPHHSFNRLGEINGEIVGGNLTIINQLIGTPSFPDLKNKILLDISDKYLCLF